MLLPSTVIVIVEVPNKLAMGFMRSVRVAPLPEMEILDELLGTSVVLLEVAVILVMEAVPPRLKGSDSAASSLIVWSARSGNETCASNAPISTVDVVSASGPSTRRLKAEPR